MKRTRSQFLFISLLNLSLIVGVTAIYAELGRHQDIDHAQAERGVGYLLAADINKARKRVNETPASRTALIELARVSMDGGLYQQAVSSLDEALGFMAEDAEVLGLKATALYYLNQRSLDEAVTGLLDRALALHPQEFNSRILLANHEFINRDYGQAISHWRMLLTNTTQSFNRSAIEFAINKAEQRRDQNAKP